MKEFIQSQTIHDVVLILVIELLVHYEQNEWPSPTIKDLSTHLGYSEEVILESLEFGQVTSTSLLQ